MPAFPARRRWGKGVAQALWLASVLQAASLLSEIWLTDASATRDAETSHQRGASRLARGGSCTQTTRRSLHVDAANHMLEAIRQMTPAEQAELFAYARHWVSERIF